jgi:excisionase family DNA binding protein
MYSTKEVMGLLKISKPTLYKLCRQKNLCPKKVGTHYRYSDQDVKRLLDTEIKSAEERFSNLVNSVWFIMVNYAIELYGKEGENKLKQMICKSNIFFMNTTSLKENKNE